MDTAKIVIHVVEGNRKRVIFKLRRYLSGDIVDGNRCNMIGSNKIRTLISRAGAPSGTIGQSKPRTWVCLPAAGLQSIQSQYRPSTELHTLTRNTNHRSGMSALGHKRTSQRILGMSALPPKADIDLD